MELPLTHLINSSAGLQTAEASVRFLILAANDGKQAPQHHDRSTPEVGQPQVLQAHLAVRSHQGLTQCCRPEGHAAILGGIPPVQLFLNVLCNCGVCANVVLLHQRNEISL